MKCEFVLNEYSFCYHLDGFILLLLYLLKEFDYEIEVVEITNRIMNRGVTSHCHRVNRHSVGLSGIQWDSVGGGDKLSIVSTTTVCMRGRRRRKEEGVRTGGVGGWVDQDVYNAPFSLDAALKPIIGSDCCDVSWWWQHTDARTDYRVIHSSR